MRNADLSITDMNGRVVQRMDDVTVNGNLAISLSGLPEGLYTLRIVSDGTASNKRFVKMR